MYVSQYGLLELSYLSAPIDLFMCPKAARTPPSHTLNNERNAHIKTPWVGSWRAFCRPQIYPKPRALRYSIVCQARREGLTHPRPTQVGGSIPLRPPPPPPPLRGGESRRTSIYGLREGGKGLVRKPPVDRGKKNSKGRHRGAGFPPICLLNLDFKEVEFYDFMIPHISHNCRGGV